MAKEKVQEAVVEETEVATAEAEVAEATEETTKETTTTDETADAGGDELSPWYYFFATGCGWCKKSSPVVEELNEDDKYPEHEHHNWTKPVLPHIHELSLSIFGFQQSFFLHHNNALIQKL